MRSAREPPMMLRRAEETGRGALVISLDFELHWGVRDHTPLDRAEKKRLLLARSLVGKILEVFREFEICATWATVGALFARTRDEFEFFTPQNRPAYQNSALEPYAERVGRSEEDDPFHFAPSLIEEIARTPGQEIASHSFSHYYCLEPGQTFAAFEEDLQSAVAIARNQGHTIRSLVFPRNQANRTYLRALRRHGILAFRGVEDTGPYRATDFGQQRQWKNRGSRLLDTFVDVYGAQSAPWPDGEGVANVRASRYLQPCRSWLRPFDDLKVKRIVGQMENAARQGRIFHLWWHPEDFATGGETNIVVLRNILTAFGFLREEYGMRSLNMTGTLAVAARAQMRGFDETG
jgi:peptidoglycan/xylan/chitin deacetylase (PgdA/CDA1 family)